MQVAKSRLKQKRNRLGYLFIAPFLIGLVLIFIPAMVESAIYAFSEVTINLDNVVKEPVGFQNFVDAFTEDINFRVLIVDAVKGMLIDLLVITIFSFFIANVLGQDFVGRNFVRTVFFLPVLLSTGIIAATDMNNLAMNQYSSDANISAFTGAFAQSGILSFLDVETILSQVNISPSVTSVILSTVDNTYNIVNLSGVQILIFYSALKSINPSIFEASKVEGATKWEEFWKITFPLMTPMILVNIVYTIVDSFTNPKYRILQYIQDTGFSGNRLGFASALSWIYFLIVLALMGIICGIVVKRIRYLD